VNPITHLLIGWEIACATRIHPKDRALLTVVSVAPDADGLGAVVDIGRSWVGAAPSFYYATYHHWLLHGLFGGILLTALACALSVQRARMAALSLIVFHLHLLCDLVGSRGLSPESLWPIRYLGPFSEKLTFQWSGQWPLNAAPNIALTLMLMVITVRRIIISGVSPTLLFGRRVDQAFVSTLRSWYRLSSRRG
jgi:hypothetical protein